MGTIKRTGWIDLGSWRAAFASLLPLWLLCLAITTEGFPRPFIPPEIALAAFLLAIAASVYLLWKGWMTFELVLYSSVSPFILIFSLDEMSTSYKTPLILLCALFLTVGIIGYQRSLYKDWIGIAWLILLVAFLATWLFSSHADQNYWQMLDLGYIECLPNGQCLPITDIATPWWKLFFQ